MKKNLCIILGIVMASIALANDPFKKAMRTNIPEVFSADNPEGLQETINRLNRIGEAEKDRWEPYYYAAFGYLRMSDMQDTDENKDQYLDLAMKTVEKAETILPNDSELETMRGYILMMQLMVDPANRGMVYSGLAFASFQKAVHLNPTNPRAHYLLGRMQHGTAQFMGGGNEEACKSLAHAISLYQEAEQPENPFAPSWGKESAKRSVEQICSEE